MRRPGIVAQEQVGAAQDIDHLDESQVVEHRVRHGSKLRAVAVGIGDQDQVKAELPAQPQDQRFKIIGRPAPDGNARPGVKDQYRHGQIPKERVDADRTVGGRLQARLGLPHPGEPDGRAEIAPIFHLMLGGPVGAQDRVGEQKAAAAMGESKPLAGADQGHQQMVSRIVARAHGDIVVFLAELLEEPQKGAPVPVHLVARLERPPEQDGREGKVSEPPEFEDEDFSFHAEAPYGKRGKNRATFAPARTGWGEGIAYTPTAPRRANPLTNRKANAARWSENNFRRKL